MRKSTSSWYVHLLHVCPAAAARSILLTGIDPAFSRSAWNVSWLCAPCRRRWAIAHVLSAHCCDAVQVLRLRVPRSWVVRRVRGVWVCRRFLPAAVHVVSVSLPLDGLSIAA